MAAPIKPLLSDEWLTNANRPSLGYPAEEYPGALQSDHEAAGTVNPQRAGPPDGGYEGNTPVPDPSGPADPGVITDTTFLEGHEAPWPVAGTSQLEPFAPPGPVTSLHGIDRGAVEEHARGPEPSSPGWYAGEVPGQSYDVTVNYDSNGMRLSQPAPMTSHWRTMGQRTDGYDPRTIPAVEPLHYAKLAQQPVPVIPGTPLGPNGSTPDMGFMYGSQAYAPEAPPAPSVPVTVPTVAQQDIGSGWA